MSADLHLQEITSGDLSLIHDMAEVAFRHTYRELLSSEQIDFMMDWMYSMPNLNSQLTDGHRFFVAYKGDIPCGYVSMEDQGVDSAGVGIVHLHKLYVMPGMQGCGVGLLLFGNVVSLARQIYPHGPVRIELNVNRYNKAVGFYRRLGMRVLREGDFHIGHGFYMTDYIMGLDVS